MKSLLSYLLLLSSFLGIDCLTAQKNPLIRNEEWQKHSTEDRLLNCREIRFEYDDFGNEILRKGFIWSTKESTLMLSYTNQKEYSLDNNLLLVEKLQVHPITTYSKNYDIKYTYFMDSQLALQSVTILYGDEPDQRRNIYYNPIHYAIDSVVQSYYNIEKEQWIRFQKNNISI